MTIKTTSSAAVLLTSLLLPAVALPVGVFAQSQTPVDRPAMAPKPKASAQKPASMTDRVEQHITQLHAALRITPAQQSQWDQFAQVMRDNATNMNKALEQRATGFASMGAADNMQSYAQVAEQHAQDTQKLATSFRALYESMSDDQKKNADAVFRANGDHPMHKKG